MCSNLGKKMYIFLRIHSLIECMYTNVLINIILHTVRNINVYPYASTLQINVKMLKIKKTFLSMAALLFNKSSIVYSCRNPLSNNNNNNIMYFIIAPIAVEIYFLCD